MLRAIFAIIYAAPWIAIYLSYVTSPEITCESASDQSFCALVHANYIFFHSLLLASLLLFPYAIVRKYHLVKWFTLSIVSALLYQAGLMSITTQINDVRIYGYELFFLFSAFYLPSMAIAFTAALIFKPKRRVICRAAAYLTILFIIAAAYFGRDAAWHHTILLGNIWIEQEDTVWLSSGLVQIMLFCVGASIVYYIANGLTSWVKTGFWKTSLNHPSLLLFVFFILLTLSTLSIPLGKAFHAYDVRSAKNYIDSLKEELENHRSIHAEYPMTIAEIVTGDSLPKLLKRHDHIMFEGSGNFYLSRPDFYCFAFHDPALSHGYYSKTTDRDWRYSHEGASFAEEFTAICDAEKPTENLVADHLGLSGTDDPLAKLHYMLGETVRPAITPGATGKLENLLDGMRGTNPELFVNPEKSIKTTSDLKESLSVPIQEMLEQAIDRTPTDNVDRREELEKSLQELRALQQQLEE